jgi:hypothetical protein
MSTITPTVTSSYSLPLDPRVTPSPTLSALSAYFPFPFPVILDQGDFYRQLNYVHFSYYFPDLGGVNCHIDNWVNGHCKNVTASHVVGWREYMRKGIAVHPDMLSALPFGSMLYVTQPPEIAGYYTVVDLCGGCLINGNYYFDFLFDSMPSNITWSVPVNYGVIRIGWDGAFPTSTSYVIPTLSYSTITPTFTPSQVPTETPLILPTSTFLPLETLALTSTFESTLIPTETPVP